MSFEPPPQYSEFLPQSHSRPSRTQSVYNPPPGPPPNMSARPASMAYPSGAGYGGGSASSQGSASMNSYRPSGATQRGSSISYPALSPSSQQGPPAPAAPPRTVQRRNTRENQMAALKRFETVLLVDDSASMVPLWPEACRAIMGIAERAVEFDADGIDIHFLCSPVYQKHVRSVAEVEKLFGEAYPQGESTPTEIRVEELLSPYIEECEAAKASRQALPRPLNLLIITDGEADDPDTLAYTIAGFADRLHAIHAPLTQLGIQFVQIGDGEEATRALQELDDNIQSASGRDMVDSTPFSGQLTGDFLLKALMGAVNRRLDASG